jgi:hypothetical protein
VEISKGSNGQSSSTSDVGTLGNKKYKKNLGKSHHCSNNVAPSEVKEIGSVIEQTVIMG